MRSTPGAAFPSSQSVSSSSVTPRASARSNRDSPRASRSSWIVFRTPVPFRGVILWRVVVTPRCRRLKGEAHASEALVAPDDWWTVGRRLAHGGTRAVDFLAEGLPELLNVFVVVVFHDRPDIPGHVAHGWGEHLVEGMWVVNIENQEAGATANETVVAADPFRVQRPGVVLLQDGGANLLDGDPGVPGVGAVVQHRSGPPPRSGRHAATAGRHLTHLAGGSLDAGRTNRTLGVGRSGRGLGLVDQILEHREPVGHLRFGARTTRPRRQDLDPAPVRDVAGVRASERPCRRLRCQRGGASGGASVVAAVSVGEAAPEAVRGGSAGSA